MVACSFSLVLCWLTFSVLDVLVSSRAKLNGEGRGLDQLPAQVPCVLLFMYIVYVYVPFVQKFVFFVFAVLF